MTRESAYCLHADDCLLKLQTWQAQRPEQLVSFHVKQRATHWWIEAVFTEKPASNREQYFWQGA